MTWDYCTVIIADCLSEPVEVPANKARRERTNDTLVRTSMPISSGSCEVKGPVIRIVSSELISSISIVEVEELGSFGIRESVVICSRVLRINRAGGGSCVTSESGVITPLPLTRLLFSLTEDLTTIKPRPISQLAKHWLLVYHEDAQNFRLENRSAYPQLR